ncbi:MAG: hypothetical protein ISS77_02520 [Phycisphaerae bacterium]|nr:hypothetical protein [Phycisphaerae bacterium]
MANKSDLPTHNEVEETVEDFDNQMDEKEEELEVLTEDTETVRDVHEQLDLETTAEGTEQLESLVDAAEDETVEIFDQEDNDLEGIQEETQDYANEIDDRHDSAQSDLEKLSDASSQIRTTETINELANAKASVLEEMDFLKDNNQRAEDAKAESEQVQQDLQSRINSGRRS